MPVFSYTGVKDNRKVRGIIESFSKSDAIQKLKSEGIIIIKISETSKKTLTSKNGSNQQASKNQIPLDILSRLKNIQNSVSLFSRISLRDIAVFSRQISSLLKAGMSLTDSLDTVAKQTKKLNFKQLIMSISEDIKGGKSFSQALGEHKNIFPEIYIGMVKSGETSGDLDKVMEDLGEYLERQIAIRSKVSSAMIYPIFVVGVMGIVLWVLLTFVVPKISQLLQDVGRSLPIYTKALILFSKIVSTSLPYLIIMFSALFFFRKKILSIPKVRYYFDLIRLKFPIYSKIHLLGETYRIFSTLSTLTKAGVPLVKAIETAENITSNIHLKKVLKEAREYTIEGKNMSERLAESEFFPPMIANMVAVGERSGELEKMFSNIAHTLSSELETFVAGVTSLIEPILIVSIGGMIFLIMLSVIVPILEINKSIM